MKIHIKLFLVLLFCIVIFITASCVQVIHLTQKQTETEKLDMSYTILKQTMLSYEYVSDMIERYMFDQCRAEGIANSNLQISNPSLLKMQMESKISIIGKNPFLLKGAIIDNQGRFFTNAEGDEAERFKATLQIIFTNNKDTLWFTDIEGRLYLKHSIYNILRNEKVADIFYEINQAYLRTSIGLNWFKTGSVCLLNEYGNMMLVTTDMKQDTSLFLVLIDEIRNGNILPRVYHFQNIEYRIIAVNGTSGSWSMLYQVRVDDLLKNYFYLRSIIILFACVLIILAAIVSYLISFVFTTNIRRLKKNINNVYYGSNISLIPSLGNDEIGDLAKHFNELLERLDKSYQAMFKVAHEKQQMRYELLLSQHHSLQAQISPHFLCNILSSISILAMSNKPGQVEKLAVDSGRYLRENLRNNLRYYNTVAGEVQLVRDYLKLINVLSAISIQMNEHIKSDLLSICIPNTLLQPLVENAVKHGIPPQFHNTFVIDIIIRKTEKDMLELVVEDNGVGFSQPMLDEIHQLALDHEMQPRYIGNGILGIVRRLALHYQDNYCFEVSVSSSGGASVRIVLPLQINTQISQISHWIKGNN